MSRPIRQPRARRLQGTRAGVVSRLLAIAIDVAVAWLIFLLVVSTAGLVLDFLHSGPVRIGSPGPWWTAVFTWAILVAVLTCGGATTGRTVGKQVLGLRTVRVDGSPLRVRDAFLRAVTYTIVPIGGLWMVVDRRNASVQDHLHHTVVVYDWVPRVDPARVTTRSSEEPT